MWASSTNVILTRAWDKRKKHLFDINKQIFSSSYQKTGANQS